MYKKQATLPKSHFSSYSFKRTVIPFPELKEGERIKPPTAVNPNVIDSSHLFKQKNEASKEEKIQQYMDNYKKAERILIINFYTGGGPYRRGVMDAIYRGYNPMKM